MRLPRPFWIVYLLCKVGLTLILDVQSRSFSICSCHCGMSMLNARKYEFLVAESKQAEAEVATRNCLSAST